ncbi:MAG: GNAT family N-acetyltransferase [Alphaproteobacteria bacterium]|jgi:8-oxo-dGTP diphosphatase|nr:GNAT family N-acetyltransferase [Alphaproteobacteria bacterium]
MSGTVLESDRLWLRPLETRDGERIYQLINDFEIVRNLSMVPWPYERYMADEFIIDSEAQARAATAIRRAIIPRSVDRLVGIIDMRFREGRVGIFGYWLGREYWQKGYVSEALGAFVVFAFEELGMNRLGAEALPDNLASLGVMRKNGFTIGDLVPQDRPNFGDTVIMRQMWLERADWEASRR